MAQMRHDADGFESGTMRMARIRHRHPAVAGSEEAPTGASNGKRRAFLSRSSFANSTDTSRSPEQVRTSQAKTPGSEGLEGLVTCCLYLASLSRSPPQTNRRALLSRSSFASSTDTSRSLEQVRPNQAHIRLPAIVGHVRLPAIVGHVRLPAIARGNRRAFLSCSSFTSRSLG